VQALKKAGLNTPKSAEISSAADCDRVAAEVGFPMIIKPTAGAASLGVCTP
jgi:D-alanine-D-alanine ligase